MKTCLICQVSLPLSDFSLSPKGRNGFHPWCKQCVREYGRSRYVNKLRPARKSAAVLLPYVPLDKTKTAQADALPGYRSASTTWYHLSKKHRIPKWLKIDDVLPFYAAAAKFGLTVDHIVPLNGKTVSGLHVPWNLQLLTRAENTRKGNRLTYTSI